MSTPTHQAVRRARWRAALLAAAVATGSCADVGDGPPGPALTSVAEVARLDRRGLQRGRAVDAEAIAVFHDPAWERLIVQADGECVTVDAAGVDPPLSPGERVHLSGFTGFERNGPVIVLPRIARLATRGVRTWTASALPTGEGVACLEFRARVLDVRQLDSEHLRLDASVEGGDVEAIVMGVPNSALLRQGDSVILRGPVESVAPAAGASAHWRMYLQGDGAFEKVGGAPPAPPETTSSAARTAAAPLTGLLAIKMLPLQEASRGLPVRVRGVVTGASPQSSGGAQEIVLQDADCGLYATTESATEAASFGSLVEIEGRTQPGAFAPIVVYSKLRVVEKAAALPRPLPPAGLDVGLSARTENAWTVVKGVLRPHSGSFAVATPDGELPLYFFQGDVGPLQDLVDAEVEVPGIFAVVHRARRVVGYRLLVQSPDRIAPTGRVDDPAARPVWPVSQLFTYWASGRPLHRISVRGAVTGVFHPNRVYVDDGTAGVLCETTDRPSAIGTIVTASGFLPASGPEHRLTRARLQPTDRSAPVAPTPVTVEEVLGGEHDGRLVRIVGRLRARERSMGREWLTLDAGRQAISAVLELPTPTSAFDGLRVGSELRLTGIGEMDWDRSRVPPRVRAARLLLRSPADLEVLRAPSWWTAGRILALLAAVLALASVSFGWVISLRRQVGRQTRLIREQVTRLHDQADERERAKQKLQKALDEQLSLLREVHHRVKNNLQAIIHLVEMERERLDDPQVRSLLDGLRERARTMALVYEQVYESPSLASVDMESYLQALGERLQHLLSAGRDIQVDIAAAGVSLDVATAMPCGLIVNELVTNAFKYAFPTGVRDRGRITVQLTHESGTVRLEVTDDGVGMRDSGPKQGGLGLQLVSLWATHQLGGRLDVRSEAERGTTFTVEFSEAQ